MNVKVAFIQNRVQKGGRFQVTVEMLKVFNELGIVPDFYCYRARITQEQIQETYGEEVQVNFKEISEPLLPFEWNIVLFNSQINRRVADYDLIVNSNNTSFGLSRGMNIISYVHFPRKFRMRSPSKSIHFPNKKKSFFDLSNDPLKFFSFLYRFDKKISDKDFQICNSKFSANALKEVYGREADLILYPPVDIDIESPDKDEHSIVSLGRFSPDKRQYEQILMMKDLPSHHLHLVGFANDRGYFEKCKLAIEENQLTNVTLHANVSAKRRDELLGSSEYFIHTLRYEPFGITTVQAIAKGCLPIVHNSGGQLEIVPVPELRFNAESEIPHILGRLSEMTEVKILKSKLVEGVMRFRSSEFRRAFKVVVLDKLGEHAES